jgi:4-amino-4-deoxy-L-arabinose transferase-like glycosyltransferase
LITQGARRARHGFLILWSAVTIVKLVVAARLPLFVDEAFYWQEGRHLAWAYSDLPGLTAWLARLGVSLGGEHPLALRLPFLAIAAALPWGVMRIAGRWLGRTAGWHAASLTVLMPLSGTLGLLALPDVPMALATVLCLHAGARLLRRIEPVHVVELGLGLAIGALSHYRFLGVIGAGCLALLCLPRGRALLRDVRVWVALAMGVAAWMPLLAWNAGHHEAGLRFQFVDRHPWRFHASGLWFVLVQAALVTPLLAGALCVPAWRALRQAGTGPQVRWLALAGGIAVLGVFVLGFFTDAERVSFHWALPGWLALLAVVPPILVRWPRPWRAATLALAALGLVAALGHYLAVGTPALRAQLAGDKFYPRNFAGWGTLAAAVDEELAAMPAGTRVLADNFKVGAELGFVRGDADIAVLPAPLNDKHGRSGQLAQWGLLGAHEDVPRLLVLSPSDMPYKLLLQRYHAVCALVGPLPPGRVVAVDHGAQRFLLFRLPPGRRPGPCVTPAMAWLDAPLPGTHVSAPFEVRGWAFKDGAGLDRVQVLVDGRPFAVADYGQVLDVRDYWKISTDPHHPHVGFAARIDPAALAPGRHWLGLRLDGTDGSVEDWAEQPFEVVR